MRICIISGSARENNNSIRVALAIKNLLDNAHIVHIIDFKEYDIPLIAQGGLKKDALSSFQKNLIDKIAEAHIVIIISPEYNWSSTPELLNMFDLFAVRDFQQIFNNKVFAFAGVSTGKGGKMPCLQLMQVTNKVISFANYHSIVSAKIFESHFTKEALDESGVSLGNEMYDKGLKSFIDYTIYIAERWFK